MIDFDKEAMNDGLVVNQFRRTDMVIFVNGLKPDLLVVNDLPNNIVCQCAK